MQIDIPSKLKMRPLIVRTNYGDESIALTQWLYESEYAKTAASVQVVYIDTGWAASNWQERILNGEAHAKRCGFTVVHLKSPITFPEAVFGRGTFPSSKFTWCTGLLKGLPLLDWLDEKTVDLEGKAIILLAKRRAATRFHQDLQPLIERCQYHADRTVWHAILDVSNVERDALLARAGFEPLNHRSLECQPCVNSSSQDLACLTTEDHTKLRLLESRLGQVFERENLRNNIANIHIIDDKTATKENYLDLFYRGCGNHFGCGL